MLLLSCCEIQRATAVLGVNVVRYKEVMDHRTAVLCVNAVRDKEVMDHSTAQLLRVVWPCTPARLVCDSIGECVVWKIHARYPDENPVL